MKEKNCKVIQDLLPSYIDKLTSDETNKYIEEHLSNCVDCSNVLNNMQEELNSNVPKIERREVDYLKKFNIRLKLFKSILMIIVILIVLFMGNLTRKIYIIRQYDKANTQNYSMITNFYAKIIEENAIVEIWRKDDIEINMLISTNGRIEWTYWGEDSTWTICNEISSNYKEAVKFPKGLPIPTVQNSLIQPLNIWGIISFAFNSKITTENVNGEECYRIHLDELFEEYVTKKDFLMVKNINGSSNQMIHYKFDIVTDEDLKMPDLTGYTVKEAD